MPFGAATFIREHQEEIVRSWEQSLASGSADIRLHGLALRDHLPELLLELASSVDRGDGADGGGLHSLAFEHAAARLDSAYGLPQVIRELRALRETLLRLLLRAEAAEQAEEGPPHMGDRVVELATLNTALDQAITSVVEQFVGERDRRVADSARLQRRYDALFDSSPDAIFVNRGDRVVLANRACAALFGVQDPSALVGRSPFELFHSEDHAAIRARIAGVLEGRSAPLREQRIVRLDGGVRDTEVAAAPFPYADGIAIQVILRDVTARNAAQRALQESEARFRTLADGTPVLIWVTDRDGQIEFVNRAYCDYFGVTLEQLRRDGWAPLIHPEDAPAYVERFRTALQGAATFRAQARVRRADGAWRWIESYAAPRLAPDGAALGMAGSSPDITELKEADDAIRASEERLQRALRHASAGAWEWRTDQPRFVWSEESYELFGVPRDEPLDAHIFSDRVEPEDLARLNATVAAVVEGREREFRCEFRVRHPTRGTRWILTVGRIEAEPGGGARVLGGLNLDITDRKRAELELLAADRRRVEFLGVLSHELRNPLAPIRNGIYLLEHAPADSAQADRARAVIRRQTEHLTHLVDDLLDVTRISRGKIQLHRTLLDLREVVRKTTDDLHSLFTGANVDLRVELATSAPVWVDADPTRMAQVLGNLLTNAVKFTSSGGSVVVRVGAHGTAAELSVRDDGIGLEPSTIERMFDPFTQADRTLARTQGGLGLGLALVKGLVELHDGAVEARSEGLGHGAELLVRLPLARLSEATAAPARGAGATARLTILIIEDNADAGRTLADILEMAGHRVEVARDGRSGIALARALRPDAVLCDIGLPDIDGYEVARVLRLDPALRDRLLVAVSGYAQPEDRARGRAAGFDAHVAKPPDFGELLHVLQRAAGHASGGDRPAADPG